MSPALGIAVGLVALVVGAEVLVRGGSRLATRLGLTPIVVGVTIVAVGTSAPELAIGIDAAATGNSGLALGNIVGTNIVNLLLVFGLSALMRSIAFGTQTLRVDLPAMTVAALLLWAMSADGHLGGGEALVLLVCGVLYTLLVIRAGRAEAASVRAEYRDEYTPHAPSGRSAPSSSRSRCSSVASPSSWWARTSSSTPPRRPRGRWGCPTP